MPRFIHSELACLLLSSISAVNSYLQPDMRVSQATSPITNPVAAKKRPQMQYITNKDVINVDDLSKLIKSCKDDAQNQKLLLSCELYKREKSKLTYEQKLKIALLNSTVVCAAYCKRSQLQSLGYKILYSENDSKLQQSQERRWWQRDVDKVLVGCARASGDGVYNGIIYDVVVHPNLRNLGIGFEVTRRVVNQLGSLDIRDLGIMCPAPTEGFFRQVWFTYDELETSPMFYTSDHIELKFSSKLKENQSLINRLQTEVA